jgi:hypothetical protein
MPADDHAGAGGDRSLDLLGGDFPADLAGQRADFGGASSGSPTFIAAIAMGEGASNSSAIGRSTMNRLAAMQLWPLLSAAALGGFGGGGGDVGIGQHDERIGAAEFEHGFLQGRAGDGGDRSTGALAAGQRDGADAGMLDDRFSSPACRQAAS